MESRAEIGGRMWRIVYTVNSMCQMEEIAGGAHLFQLHGAGEQQKQHDHQRVYAARHGKGQHRAQEIAGEGNAHDDRDGSETGHNRRILCNKIVSLFIVPRPRAPTQAKNGKQAQNIFAAGRESWYNK